jgi:hypothetical protein
MKKLEVSIEKLQTRSACAKVLATPPVSVIEEDETTKRKRKRKKTTKRRRRRRRRVITIQEGSVVEDDIEIALKAQG